MLSSPRRKVPEYGIWLEGMRNALQLIEQHAPAKGRK